MSKYQEADRLKRLNDRIESERVKFNETVNNSGMIERRREAMESHPDYQRKQRLGHDGRMREAVEILSKNIHERNHHGEALPSYSKAQEHAAQVAERVAKKLGR
jgi:hypothetical protein